MLSLSRWYQWVKLRLNTSLAYLQSKVSWQSWFPHYFIYFPYWCVGAGGTTLIDSWGRWNRFYLETVFSFLRHKIFLKKLWAPEDSLLKQKRCPSCSSHGTGPTATHEPSVVSSRALLLHAIVRWPSGWLALQFFSQQKACLQLESRWEGVAEKTWPKKAHGVFVFSMAVEISHTHSHTHGSLLRCKLILHTVAHN